MASPLFSPFIMPSEQDASSSSITVIPDIPDPSILADPPPPYPDPQRRHHRTSRAHRYGRLHAHHQEGPAHLDFNDGAVEEDDEAESSENTPFLNSNRPRAAPTTSSHVPRQRSFSESTTSVATSLTRTVFSLFHADDVDEGDEGRCRGDYADDSRYQHHHHPQAGDAGSVILSTTDCCGPNAWKRYFRPLRRKVYYKALFHLFVLNFPYALIAWLYLFVFTVTGTTLLIALPLGAVLCFFDLLGARAFSRGELYLQIHFHGPHLPPYHPRPIFTRLREPTPEEYESGRVVRISGRCLVKERSFYKNTYTMFTDPTSYQALFYFLVIKPALTLLISIGMLTIGIPSLILVFPAPAILRAIRRIGIWQANIAIEGLYYPVR